MRRRCQATIGAFGGINTVIIDKHVSHRLSIDLQTEKPSVALRFLALFAIDPHPVLQLIAGATIITTLLLISQSKVE